MEKDYQQYTNTCGAASGKMVVNYLTGQTLDDDAFLERFVAMKGRYNYSLESVTDVVNSYLNSEDQLYEFCDSFLTQNNLQERIVKSINKAYPVVINIKPLETYNDQVIGFGYCYREESDTGHYVVVKGLYYNSDTQKYDSVINETHYKFGAHPLGKYGTTEQVNRLHKDIGGRDTVVCFDILYQVYTQRHYGLMYM